MKIIIQRVKKASVEIENKEISSIGYGLLLLIGITPEDTQNEIDYLTNKITKLRIFNDQNNLMNLNITQVQGEVLAVSQFTLLAQTKKGNRPSYIKAARPEYAEPLFNSFVNLLSAKLNQEVKTGVFGAEMDVQLINHGPVTIILDTNEI